MNTDRNLCQDSCRQWRIAMCTRFSGWIRCSARVTFGFQGFLIAATLFSAAVNDVSAQMDNAGQSSAQTGENRCPDNQVCIAIPGVTAARGIEERKKPIYSSAIPDIMQITLLRYPGVHPVPTGVLWQAVRSVYASPDEWRPRNLSKREVLGRAGANYVLKIRIYARQGSMQLSGYVVSLKDDDKWRSKTIRSNLFPENRLIDGAVSFSSEVVDALARDGILDYRMRLFVTLPFCDMSPFSSRQSAGFASDLARDLGQRVGPMDVAKVKFGEGSGCMPAEEAFTYARSKGVDGVVTGAIAVEESVGSVTINAKVFIPEKELTQTIPLDVGPDSGYLEKKYLLLDRFRLFLKAALTENGKWNMDVLDVPEGSSEFFGRIDTMIENRQLDAAEFLLLTHVVNEPASIGGHFRLGRVRYQQGRLGSAVEQQQRVIVLDPGFVDAYQALGDAYVAMKKYEQAESAYRKLLKLQPDASEAYVALGNIANFEGHKEEAIQMYQEAIRADEGNSSARTFLSGLYFDLGKDDLDDEKYKQAYEYFDLALKVDSRPDAERHFRRAYSFARSITEGKLPASSGYKPAIEDYVAAIEIDRRGEDAGFRNLNATYMNLQELYLLEDEFEKTVSIAQEYLGLDEKKARRNPEDELISHFYIAIALILANESYEDSIRDLEAQLDRKERMREDWSFDLIDKFLKKKQSTMSTEQALLIERLRAEVENRLRA